MIVGVFKAGLQCIMVDIRHRTLGAHARYAHRFKFQIRHGAGRILRQRLVDLQTDLAARFHLAADEVGTNQFLCKCITHEFHLPSIMY